VIENPLNVLLMTEGRRIISGNPSPESTMCNTSFLENYRGRHAIRASLAAYRWMFTHTDCMILQTRVPAFNKAAANSASWSAPCMSSIARACGRRNRAQPTCPIGL